MAILVRIGERLYEFADTKAVATGRAIYAQCTGNQNDFESQMEASGLDFTIELEA